MPRRFFFQAEDGIRYLTVTGVQTCALPIFPRRIPNGHRAAATVVWLDGRDLERNRRGRRLGRLLGRQRDPENEADTRKPERSEERRVGKERKYGLAP